MISWGFFGDFLGFNGGWMGFFMIPFAPEFSFVGTCCHLMVILSGDFHGE